MSKLNQAHALALLTPLALMGGALVSQYVFGLYPCEMCHWQRWPHYAAIPLALLAILMRGRPAGAIPLALAAVAILASGLIGAFHAGVEYGWWQGLTACSTTASAGGDPLASIMNAPLVRCDRPQWTLGPISLAGFNAIFSVGAALTILWLVRQARRDHETR